jgi:prevent-host-death family protein
MSTDTIANHIKADMTVKTFKSDEARLKLRDILDDVFRGDTEVVIERYNKPTAVVVNYDQWQALKRQQQKDLLAKAKQISSDIDSGKMGTTSHDELMRLMIEKQAGNVGD